MDDTVDALISRSAERYGDGDAIRTGSRVVSYRELDAAIDALAACLVEIGVAGARIGLLLPNVPVFPQAFYGILRAGSAVVFLNPLCSAREIRESVADSGLNTVLTVERFEPLLPTDLMHVRVDGLPDRVEVVQAGQMRTIRLAPGRRPPNSAASTNNEAVIAYTAADHGWARGARLSHGNLVANLRSSVEAMRFEPADRVLAALPLVHMFGLTVTLNAPLAAGGCIVPLERFHPVRVLELLEQGAVTVISGVPAMYMALLAAAERRGVPSHRLRLAISGGAPLPAGVPARWEKTFGLPLREGYGLTEAGPVCLFNRTDRPNRPGTLGYAFPDVEVNVCAPDGEPLPPGEVGEICVRGANVFLGYIGDDGRNPRDFHGDALRTGDLGNEEPDGAIRFRGFLKPMFTRNGFNVYPHEVERALTEDSRIDQATVCALPDPDRENEVVLAVRPAAGVSLDVDTVREICAARLAAYKQPGRIEISGN